MPCLPENRTHTRLQPTLAEADVPGLALCSPSFHESPDASDVLSTVPGPAHWSLHTASCAVASEQSPCHPSPGLPDQSTVDCFLTLLSPLFILHAKFTTISVSSVTSCLASVLSPLVPRFYSP